MIDKHDIPKLEIILDALIKSNSEINHNKFSNHDYFTETNSEDRKREFQRMIDYFEKYNCARIIQHGYFNSLIKNHKTVKFKEDGGFEKLYQVELIEQERENKNQKRSDIKLYWDSKLSKLKYITFWPIFIFGLVGGIYSLYELITSSRREERLNKIELNTQKNTKSIKEVRTLVLDQKKVDSLRNSKNHVDSLNKK